MIFSSLKNISGGPQFTKPISNLAIVTKGYFQQLNCFAENYTDITWFKDGEPYPEWNYMAWLSGWVELRHNNQSLMLAKTPKEAAGVYRCEVSDGVTEPISHEITLRVLGKRL